MFFFSLSVVFMMTISCVKCNDDGVDVTSRLLALEKKIERQAAQMIDLQETVFAQQQRISVLTEKVVAQDNDKKEMMRELRELKRKSFNRERTLRRWMKMARKTPPLLHHNDDHESRPCDDLKATGSEKSAAMTKVNAVVNEKKRFVLDTLETVAFEATIASGKYVEHTHIHDRIVFDTASLNVGNGYNPGNGTFIAPVGGIYIFSTSVMMHGANTQDLNMHIIIEKNNVEIAGAFGYNQGPYEHSSVTTAMDLQPGDTVVVAVERHDDITFYGDKLTSFMGFLLYPF